MILAAHAIAISCYLGAVVIATAPFARPVRAPVTGVALALAAGLLPHATGLVALVRDGGATAVTGLGPALWFAAFAVAAALLAVELIARDATLTLVAGAMYPVAHRDLKSLRFGTRKTNTFLDAGARGQVVDPRARNEPRARGRGTGVVDAASYRFGVQDAVQREVGAVDEPAPADHVACTFRFTNPGTDE